MGYYQTKWEFILRVSGNDKYDMVCDISSKTLIVYGPIHSFFLVANKYRKKRWSLAFHYFRLEKVEHSSQLNPLLLFGFVVVGSTLFRKSNIKSCLVPRKFEWKYKEKKIKRKNRRKKMWRKIKNRFKVNKLFLYANSNSFHLF